MDKIEELRETLNKYVEDGRSFEELLPLSEELDRHIVGYMRESIDLEIYSSAGAAK